MIDPSGKHPCGNLFHKAAVLGENLSGTSSLYLEHKGNGSTVDVGWQVLSVSVLCRYVVEN